MKWERERSKKESRKRKGVKRRAAAVGEVGSATDDGVDVPEKEVETAKKGTSVS